MAYPAETHSTPRDLIAMLVMGKERLFDLVLLGIRSSGCKAHIVLFALKNRTWDPSFTRIMDLTETELISEDFPRIYTHEWSLSTWLLKFLVHHVEDYDRIFRIDAFDVWFERDPFQIFEPDDGMIFFMEFLKQGQEKWNTLWVMGCFGRRRALSILCHYYIVNGGTIIGTTRVWMHFLRFFLQDKYWDYLFRLGLYFFGMALNRLSEIKSCLLDSSCRLGTFG
jgi:hypothetical protein